MDGGLDILINTNTTFPMGIQGVALAFWIFQTLGNPRHQEGKTLRSIKRLTLAALQRLSDNYSKVILTLDEDPETDYEGIRRINALEWLVGKTALDA